MTCSCGRGWPDTSNPPWKRSCVVPLRGTLHSIPRSSGRRCRSPLHAQLLSKVQSIQLEIKYKDFRDTAVNIQKTAKAFTEALSEIVEPLSSIKKVRLDDIQLETADDKKYIFRVIPEDGAIEELLEAEIQELADSMEKNGQLHPLILIQNGHGKYRILCGFRRFQALKRFSL